MTKHLWEIDHPYYGPEGNYYANSYQTAEWKHSFDNWGEFLKEDMSELDFDMNFLFRWDWQVPDPDDYEDGEDIPGEYLELFWVLPRKGTFLWATITVSREDEETVREWLVPRWGYMQRMWEGIA